MPHNPKKSKNCRLCRKNELFCTNLYPSKTSQEAILLNSVFCMFATPILSPKSLQINPADRAREFSGVFGLVLRASSVFVKYITADKKTQVDSTCLNCPDKPTKMAQYSCIKALYSPNMGLKTPNYQTKPETRPNTDPT